MAKRKGAQLALSSVAAVPNGLQIEEISQPPAYDRFSRAMTFGGIGIEEIGNILRAAETGQQRQVQDLYDYMLESDPHLASVCQTRVLGVASLPWGVRPGKVRPGSGKEALAQVAADVTQRMYEGIERFQRTLKELANDGILKQYAVQEIMWTRRDGMWVPDRLIWRHPRRFNIGAQWDVRLYDDGKYGGEGIALHPKKFVVHIPKERAGYVTRSGVLRAAAWDWIFKKWSIKFMLSAAERFGTPTPYGFTDETTADVVREALREGLENLTSGHAAMFVGNTRIDALDASAANPQLFENAVNIFNANMTKLALGSTGNVELGGVGSQAALTSQAKETIDPRVVADANELQDTLNESVTKTFIEFNLHLFGGEMPPMPVFEFTPDKQTETPLPPAVFVDNLFSVNEIRRSYGQDPIPGAEGERRVNIQAATPAPQFSAFVPPAGAAPERPLARGLTSQVKSTPTAGTSEHFATTPLGRALLKPLVDRQS